MTMQRLEFGRLLFSVDSQQAEMLSREFKAAGGDRAALAILVNNGWDLRVFPARPNPGEIDLPTDWKDMVEVVSRPRLSLWERCTLPEPIPFPTFSEFSQFS